MLLRMAMTFQEDRGKKALCDHAGLWRPLGFVQLSYDPLQGTNQMKGKVMGYSVICLSRGFHSRVRRPSRRNIFTVQIYGKASFLRLCTKATYRLNTFVGIQKGPSVCLCVCVCVCACLSLWGECARSETRRKKWSLYIEVTGPGDFKSLYFRCSSKRSRSDKGISRAHILSLLCQLIAFPAVSY